MIDQRLASDEDVRNFLSRSDSFEEFINERVVEDANGVVSVHDLYKSFRDWCFDGQIRVMFARLFWEKVHFYYRDRCCMETQGVKGISLKGGV